MREEREYTKDEKQTGEERWRKINDREESREGGENIKENWNWVF